MTGSHSWRVVNARRVRGCVQDLARFIIADLTDPSSVPQELAIIILGTLVPVQTILLDAQREYAMFPDLKRDITGCGNPTRAI